MNALKLLQIATLLLMLLMIIGFVLAIFGRLPWTQFWILAACMALCAYWLIPSIRKKLEANR
ncbi:MAG: hypothetical protein AABY01_02320 [Nanoarchaeota archaeon]